MKYFQENVKIRMTEEQRELVETIISAKQDKYENLSHFIRCAINKLVREEQK